MTYQSVRLHEAIRHDLNNTSAWLESVHLLRKNRLWSKELEVPICRICEPDVACDGMLTSIIRGREVLATKEAVDYDVAPVCCWVDRYKT